MTSPELAEFMALDEVEPWDPNWRRDVGVGVIASTLANVNRGKKAAPFKVQDFMPDFRSTKERSGSLSKSVRKIMGGLVGGKDK